MRVGVAVRDITPTCPVAMAGFAARTDPAIDAHDPLLLQALVVDDTALVTVDVVGLDADTCTRIRAGSGLHADAVVVHALHTHGGPASMPGRLGGGADEVWLDAVVSAAGEAIAEARSSAVDATVHRGVGRCEAVARNRRRDDGPVDHAVPVVEFRRPSGAPIAVVTSYACHPVVLGADNLRLTADYPGIVRRRVGEARGVPVLFLTGCAGDVNTGHKAEASWGRSAQSTRTFEECTRVGGLVADAVLGVELVPSGGSTTHATVPVVLDVDLPTADRLDEERTGWAVAREGADVGTQALLDQWIAWADRELAGPGAAVDELSVSVLRWGGATLVALPGEPFSVAAHRLRAHAGDEGLVVAGYCNGVHGYLPAVDEIEHGGYEVCDAHRYYGAPGPYRAGSLEQLLDAAAALLEDTSPTP